MEKNMSRVRPEALTDNELERFMYASKGTLPPQWSEELMRRFIALDVAALPDPRQLQLFE